VNQRIQGFHADEEGHWVADLECGHGQHVRHDPPWMERPWVLTDESRRARLGAELNCKRCDEMAAAVAEAIRDACGAAAADGFEQAGLSGLCAEGRRDLALDRIRALDLRRVWERAVRDLRERNARNEA
jgi:hypothetical protein